MAPLRSCGWWQASGGPCAGCSHKSRAPPNRRAPPKPTGTSLEPLTQEVLQKRWQEAKTSASQPHHVKIERLCKHCLLRTLNSKPDCRGCGHSLQDCARILPGQWPPLGCTATMLRNFGETQPLTTAPVEPPAKEGDKPEPMEQENLSHERPLLNVSVASL